MNWRIQVMAFLIKSKIGDVLWRELMELVKLAENSGEENKARFVVSQLTWPNASSWFKNLCLEIAVAYLFKR